MITKTKLIANFHTIYLKFITINGKTIKNLTLRLSKILRTPTLCHSTGNHGDDANAGQTPPHRFHGYYSKLQCSAQPSVPTCLLPSDGPTLTKVTHRIPEPWRLHFYVDPDASPLRVGGRGRVVLRCLQPWNINKSLPIEKKTC